MQKKKHLCLPVQQMKPGILEKKEDRNWLNDYWIWHEQLHANENLGDYQNANAVSELDTKLSHQS